MDERDRKKWKEWQRKVDRMMKALGWTGKEKKEFKSRR